MFEGHSWQKLQHKLLRPRDILVAKCDSLVFNLQFASSFFLCLYIRKAQLKQAQIACGRKLFSTTCYIIDLRDLLDLSQISGLITSNKPKTFLYWNPLFDFWDRWEKGWGSTSESNSMLRKCYLRHTDENV